LTAGLPEAIQISWNEADRAKEVFSPPLELQKVRLARVMSGEGGVVGEWRDQWIVSVECGVGDGKTTTRSSMRNVSRIPSITNNFYLYKLINLSSEC
jgi:hypothetical protein